MPRLESEFQKQFMDKVRALFPGCIIMKNDSGYLQGVPDWTILYNGHWATLEMKKSRSAAHQPNQDYYVDKLDGMSFARFVYPENEDEVLNDLYQTFNS